MMPLHLERRLTSFSVLSLPPFTLSVRRIMSRLKLSQGHTSNKASCLVSPKEKEPSLPFPSWVGKPELLISTRRAWDLDNLHVTRMASRTDEEPCCPALRSALLVQATSLPNHHWPGHRAPEKTWVAILAGGSHTHLFFLLEKPNFMAFSANLGGEGQRIPGAGAEAGRWRRIPGLVPDSWSVWFCTCVS